MAGRSLPAWDRPSQACKSFLTGATARTCAPVAAVVGTVRTAISQGAVLLNGHLGVPTAARIAANYVIPNYVIPNYVIPYCVVVMSRPGGGLHKRANPPVATALSSTARRPCPA